MIWAPGTPNPKQQRFFLARGRYVAYGGARGGGKSWAVRIKALGLCLRYPGIRVLILRRTRTELYQNIVQPMLSEIVKMLKMGACTYRDSKHELDFENGSRNFFGYLENDKDLLQYQGVEYDVIFLEEATHFTEHQFRVLDASCRGANDFPHRIYLTCNPGGVGHTWVKRLFVDREYQEEEDPKDYEFIQALVYDNAVLMAKNPEYEKALRRLPEKLRKGWLEGEWDLFDGQFFAEFRREKHVCTPFEIPSGWRRYVSLDYGLDMLAAYWIAVDEEGRAVVYRELYEGRDNGKGQDGRGHIVSAAARRLLEMNGQDTIDLWLAPPDLWNRNRDTGRSTAEIFASNGLLLTQTSNDRINGWRAVREWLDDTTTKDGSVGPWMRIFANCTNLIRTLPALQFDDRRPEDAADNPHELTHGPDALRGFCAWRAMAAQAPMPEHDGLQKNFHAAKTMHADEVLGYGDEIEVI